MPHRIPLLLLTSLGLLAASACSASFDLEGTSGGAPSGTPTGSSASSGSGGSGGSIEVNLGGGNAPTGFTYTELCGEPQGCFPGSAACPAVPPDGSGGGDAGGGGMGGGGTGGGGMGGAGGAVPTGGGGPIVAACQLGVDETSSVVATCQVPGSSAPGEPCIDSSDCGAGLGCVAPGVCREYCCGQLEACPPTTFCAPRPLVDADLPVEVTEAPMIPVCSPVKNCSLLEDSTCPEGLTCTIVREDGTTSCVTPGAGLDGDSCPCAPGHVCAASIGLCFELCRLERRDACPAGYTCQGGGANYTDGFGVCVQN